MTTAWTSDLATQDAARAVRLTLFWGLDGIALRTIGGARVPHITEGPLRRRLEDAELPVVALEPGLFEGSASSRSAWMNDVAALDEVAPFARRAGCDLIRIGALGLEGEMDDRVTALRSAGDAADRLGLRLAVRNEAGTAIASGAALAEVLTLVSHSAVGADWRPADGLEGGEAPADAVAALTASNAIWVVGVRDPVAGGLEGVIGRGGVGWDECLDALVASGFDGPLVLDGLPDPARTAGLASSTALVRMARAAARSKA